jgi:hypothetical protein
MLMRYDTSGVMLSAPPVYDVRLPQWAVTLLPHFLIRGLTWEITSRAFGHALY